MKKKGLLSGADLRLQERNGSRQPGIWNSCISLLRQERQTWMPIQHEPQQCRPRTAPRTKSGSHDARTRRPPDTNVPSLCGHDGVAE